MTMMHPSLAKDMMRSREHELELAACRQRALAERDSTIGSRRRQRAPAGEPARQRIGLALVALGSQLSSLGAALAGPPRP